jgi:hypothetical protein
MPSGGVHPIINCSIATGARTIQAISTPRKNRWTWSRNKAEIQLTVSALLTHWKRHRGQRRAAGIVFRSISVIDLPQLFEAADTSKEHAP